MAQTGVVAWSTSTGSANATTDSNVNWAEGMPPASVNDSARNEMASVAKWRDDFGGGLTAGGTSTAYTLTSNQTFSTLGYLNAARLCFSVNTTNGAAATLNVDGLGAKAIQISTATALEAGTLLVGKRYDVSYNSSGGYFLIDSVTNTFNNIAASGAITAATISTSGTANFAGTLTGAAINGSSISTGTAVVSSTLSVGGVATFSAGVTGLIAAQSDQETATSTTLAVSPGRQQFHPSAAKAWATCDGDGGSRTSYNFTSTADGGTAIINWTIATDFSSVEYPISTGTYGGNIAVTCQNLAAGTFDTVTYTTNTLAGANPTRISVSLFGDQ